LFTEPSLGAWDGWSQCDRRSSAASLRGGGNALLIQGAPFAEHNVDPKGGGLTSVSCPLIDYCVAADFDGRTVSFRLR
jgi:hypothetical protein